MQKELTEMKLNRKRVVTGLVATGLVAGALAGGGAALAATSATPTPAASASAGPPCGSGAGHFGGMHGIWSGRQPGLAAAATYLSLSQTEVPRSCRRASRLRMSQALRASRCRASRLRSSLPSRAVSTPAAR